MHDIHRHWTLSPHIATLCGGLLLVVLSNGERVLCCSVGMKPLELGFWQAVAKTPQRSQPRFRIGNLSVGYNSCSHDR